MRKLSTFIILAIISTLAIAQERVEVRDVTGFTEIDVSEGIKVELTYGGKEYVEVTADKEYIDLVVTEVLGNELTIYMKGVNWNGKSRKVLVKIIAPKIESLEASSGASIESQNVIESDELEMSTGSGASLKIAFKSATASCEASSGSSAKLKGSTNFFDVEASSGASINAESVEAVKVKADVSSGGSVFVNVKDEIHAEASSGGTIKYNGNPQIVDIEKSSGGSVRKR